MIGKTILHYKIVEKLGEGGMGVVYKAEDAKLECTVAIKFRPGQIAGNSEEGERFKIEAKAAAALNHPNIATIHAIEEVEPAPAEAGVSCSSLWNIGNNRTRPKMLSSVIWCM